jgi:HSP20 family molecular chaperone IbpA
VVEGLQIAKRSPSVSVEDRGEGVILTVDLPF